MVESRHARGVRHAMPPQPIQLSVQLARRPPRERSRNTGHHESLARLPTLANGTSDAPLRSEPHAHTRSYPMSSVMSLTTLLGAVSLPGLALALVTARARRYLRLHRAATDEVPLKDLVQLGVRERRS